MKHIRTNWGEIIYTVELTEQERMYLENLVLTNGNMDDATLLDSLREIGRTHP